MARKNNANRIVDPSDFEVAFTLHRPLLPNDHAEGDHIVEICGEIRPTDVEGMVVPVGCISARLFTIERALDSGVSLFEIFDSVDQGKHPSARYLSPCFIMVL